MKPIRTLTRGRRCSSSSVEESGDRGGRIKYVPERAALKPVPKNADPDNWPCYVLEDTTIFLKDGRTIGNLLRAELEGSYVVRGRLVVDGEFHSNLVGKKMNGQYIEIANCEGFSVGSGPITLWALGQSGWLEIRPSEKYQKMYSRMAEAISIYYFVTELYEETREMGRKGSKVTLSIDKILLRFAIHEGTGLVRSEAAEKIKGHAEFLLSQMRKGDSVLWKSTLFFKWLSSECHDVYTKLLRKTGEAILPPSRIALADLPTPIPQAQQPGQEPKPKSKTLPHHSRVLIPPSGPSHSTPTPDPSSLPETGAPLPIILTLMSTPDLNVRGGSPVEKITLSKLGTLLYYKYTIKTVALTQEIIKLNAKAVLASLGPEWKVAPIYGQLREISLKREKTSELRTQAMAMTELKKRQKAGAGRKGPTGLNGQFGRRSLKQDSGNAPSPEPHASKSLLPPLSGRRSGKQAGLRLAGSPAMKRDVVDRELSSDDDNYSRPRKRRRPSPPEMGDDSDASPPPLPNSLLSQSRPDSELEEETPRTPEPRSPISLKVVTESLLTLSPSGPNGSWTCDREDCVFVVRDAESEEGRKKIREHFSEHVDRLEREALVREEAAQMRLPIDHLLEKLRGLGESARLGGKMAEVIAGRIVPAGIKRDRGMAV